MTALSYATRAGVKVRLNIGTADTTDDALLDTVCGQINGWLEDKMGRQVGPIASTTYTFDGDGSDELYVPIGIRAVTELKIADQTGGDLVAETNYVVLPRVQDRRPGWPGFYLRLTDLAPVRFCRGYGTVTVTMTAGWDAIPTSLTEVAEVAIVRAWAARQSGQTDISGTDENGNPVVSRYISGKDMRTNTRYSVDYLVAG
jgi:hypothetical protein